MSKPIAHSSQERESSRSAKEVVSVSVLTGTLTLLLGGAAIASWPNGPVDFWGDLGKARTQEEIDEHVATQQQAIFAQDLSPNQRYALSYLGEDTFEPVPGLITTIEVGSVEGSNGIIGKMRSAFDFNATERDIHLTPAETCLEGTAYDISSSVVRGGAVNAVASLALESNTLVVYPAQTDGHPLRFIVGDGGFLEAEDTATTATLEAYGCDAEIKM